MATKGRQFFDAGNEEIVKADKGSVQYKHPPKSLLPACISTVIMKAILNGATWQRPWHSELRASPQLVEQLQEPVTTARSRQEGQEGRETKLAPVCNQWHWGRARPPLACHLCGLEQASYPLVLCICKCKWMIPLCAHLSQVISYREGCSLHTDKGYRLELLSLRTLQYYFHKQVTNFS